MPYGRWACVSACLLFTSLFILPVPGTRVHTLRAAAAAALEEETWIFAHINGSLAHSVRVRQCGCVNILNLYRVLTPSLINSYRPFGRATPLSQDRYPTASQEERCLLQPIQQQQQKKVRVPPSVFSANRVPIYHYHHHHQPAAE